MKWITRERVKVDRVACPWLIKKFVDQGAEFVFVPSDKVMEEAKRLGAIPYDVKDVELGHHGKECSFEAILKKYGLTKDPALILLGKIVNGADTDNTPGSGRRGISPSRIQGRSRPQRGGMDRLRRALRLLPGDGPAGQAQRRFRLVRTEMLHRLLDAFCEGLAAHRKYERLTSMGMRHDLALRVALFETSHGREVTSTRRTSTQSAFLIAVAAVGAWIDRRILRAKAGLSRLLIGMEAFR